jgi:predicted permease
VLPFHSLSDDLRHSFRQLQRAPAFSILSVAMLAAGIAASAAMFTVVDSVLLRPLPYRNPDQLVQIREAGKKGASMFGAPYMDIQQWRERSRTLQAIAFHTYDKPTSYIEGNTGPVQVNTPKVSKNLFATLGVRPAIGQDFDTDEWEKQPNNTVMLSDTAWRDGFGADRNILGKIIRVNGNAYTVVGVMPRGFQFPFNPEKPQIWIPVELRDRDKVRTKNEAIDYRIIARLKNGVSLQQAESELRVIQSGVAPLYSDPHARENADSVESMLYSDTIVEGNVREALLALLAASGMLWLIASVNVTSLMLARSIRLRREIAVRAALGASHWRIAQQLFVQGLLLSAAACLLGLGLAFASLRVFENQIATQVSFQVAMHLNATFLFVVLSLTAASAAVSSVWPAIVAIRTPIETALRQGSIQSTGGAHQSTRSTLVVIQVATSVALLVGCGLLLRTILAMKQVSLGYRTDHIIVADMVIPAYKFEGKNMTTELYQPLVDKVQRLPEVEAASLTTAVPLGKRFPILFEFAADEKDPESTRLEDLVAQFRAVGPGLQRVFGFRMLRGRFFNEDDTSAAEPVVVVNRAFVKAYFGDNRDPGVAVGQELMSYGKDKLAHIIGVIDDERQSSILEQSKPEIEVCIPQITPQSMFYGTAEGLAMNLAIRTARRPSEIIPELRNVFRSTSPELASSTFTTMDQVLEDSYGDRRLASHLLQFFGASALFLCVGGLYGLLAYLVTQRTREMGVRIALGAQKRQMIWLIMRQACLIMLLGSTAGLAISFIGTRVVANLLYGVKAHDAWTIGAAVSLLLVTGLSAAYIPAQRAAKVNPMEALRSE